LYWQVKNCPELNIPVVKRTQTGRPYGRVETQAQPNFGGSLLFMHIPCDAELINLTW